jgi:hypothetical protein
MKPNGVSICGRTIKGTDDLTRHPLTIFRIRDRVGFWVRVTLQEPKDLITPATGKVVFTILQSPEASLLQA